MPYTDQVFIYVSSVLSVSYARDLKYICIYNIPPCCLKYAQDIENTIKF